MNILRPDLTHFGRVPDMPLRVTNPHHIMAEARDFLSEGQNMIETGRKIGADAVIRSGTFTDAMLNALDQVSAHQQFASELHQASIIDPDSVNVHDITIAQAQANMSLNITRNVLNRMVQGWRELINTR
jgi:flagellar hook-basal body complex protein FliE